MCVSSVSLGANVFLLIANQNCQLLWIFFSLNKVQLKGLQENPDSNTFLLEQSLNCLNVPLMLQMGGGLVCLKMVTWQKCFLGKQTIKINKIYFIS